MPLREFLQQRAVGHPIGRPLVAIAVGGKKTSYFKTLVKVHNIRPLGQTFSAITQQSAAEQGGQPQAGRQQASQLEASIGNGRGG